MFEGLSDADFIKKLMELSGDGVHECDNCGACGKDIEEVEDSKDFVYMIEKLFLDDKNDVAGQEPVLEVFTSIRSITAFGDKLGADMNEDIATGGIITTGVHATEDIVDMLGDLGKQGKEIARAIPEGVTACMPILHVISDLYTFDEGEEIEIYKSVLLLIQEVPVASV
jgi:hypothetical protein